MVSLGGSFFPNVAGRSSSALITEAERIATDSLGASPQTLRSLSQASLPQNTTQQRSTPHTSSRSTALASCLATPARSKARKDGVLLRTGTKFASVQVVQENSRKFGYAPRQNIRRRRNKRYAGNRQQDFLPKLCVQSVQSSWNGAPAAIHTASLPVISNTSTRRNDTQRLPSTGHELLHFKKKNNKYAAAANLIQQGGRGI